LTFSKYHQLQFSNRPEMSDSTENLDELFEYHREKLDKFEEWISTQPHIPKNFRENF